MKGFVSFFMLFFQAFAISLSAAAGTGNGQGAPASGATSKKFKTHFVSLSPRHTIAPSSFIFTGQDTFEIKTPGADYLETSGGYTKNNILFEAGFKATILKQKKHYLYAFSAKGVYLGSYIAGMVVLEETIKETKQNHKVTFIFLGTSDEVPAGGEGKDGLFPF